MSKKRNIARVKLCGSKLFDLKCASERDYIATFSRSSDILDGGGYCNFHVTLHTSNGRVTNKITDFGGDGRDFNDILLEAERKGFYVSRDESGNLKDIDINKGERYLDLGNSSNVGLLFGFGINDAQSDKPKIIEFFKETRKSDEIFQNVYDVNFSKGVNVGRIMLLVNRNMQDDINKIKDRLCQVEYVEKIHAFRDELNGDMYNFFVIVADDRCEIYKPRKD